MIRRTGNVTLRCHSQRKYHYTPNAYFFSTVNHFHTSASSLLNQCNDMSPHSHNLLKSSIYQKQKMKMHYSQKQKLLGKRYLSDNLLGYNPMAPNQSINKNTKSMKEPPKGQGPFIGVDSNTQGGGVWAQTSAKRDKLGELKMELKFDLGQRSLDDLATQEEELDLFLVDGARAVMEYVDNGNITLSEQSVSHSHKNDQNISHPNNGSENTKVQALMKEIEQSISDDDSDAVEITKEQFDSLLSDAIDRINDIRENHPAAPAISNDDTERGNVYSALVYVRDFISYEQPNEPIPTELCQELYTPVSDPFKQCSEYFHILLLKSALEHLSTQWEELTMISSADQDRAATRGEILSSKRTINFSKLLHVLNMYASGSCSDRVKAVWDLFDKDDDGLLDQKEMDKVVYTSLKPVEDAVSSFMSDNVDAWPMRSIALPEQNVEQHTETNEQSVEIEKTKIGFFKRWTIKRKEQQAKKVLLKLLGKTVKNHFDVEVETPHRLRCIYAWAEKKDQDGKTESVLVEDSNAKTTAQEGDSSSSNALGFLSGGRKRYVELDPKISYLEFREVQKEHFAHLDRIGQELCTSLKEDLWVHQGKGRQNQELKRETVAFLFVVSLIDYAIIIN